MRMGESRIGEGGLGGVEKGDSRFMLREVWDMGNIR